jgi:hypothetical protein
MVFAYARHPDFISKSPWVLDHFCVKTQPARPAAAASVLTASQSAPIATLHVCSVFFVNFHDICGRGNVLLMTA